MLFSQKAVSVIEFYDDNDDNDDNFRRVMLCLESQNAISGKLLDTVLPSTSFLLYKPNVYRVGKTAVVARCHSNPRF